MHKGYYYMNKTELIEALAERTGLAKSESEKMVNAFVDTITEQLVAGNEVTLTGFGTYMAKRREARMGVNPQNPSQKIQIPAVTVPKFKAGKSLKDALKNA